MQIETTRQYVLRKLKSPAYNHAEIVRRTGISKSNISELKNGIITDPQCSTVEKLSEYFQEVDK